MAYEKKDGDITLNVNNKTSDKQPDMRGSIRMKGKDYEIALWKKQGTNGPFYSGHVGKEVQPRGERQGQSSFQQSRPAPAPASSFDDEIPWK